MPVATDFIFLKFLQKGLKSLKTAPVRPNYLFWIWVNDQNSANGILVESLYHKTTFTPTKLLKTKKSVFGEHFYRFFTIFQLKTSMWSTALRVFNTHSRIKTIGSNKLYWVYYSICSLTFMVPWLIFSGQGGQYLR